MEGIGVLFVIGIFVAVILLMRLFGAWMLRIDEVIKQQKATNEYLRDLRDKGNGV